MEKPNPARDKSYSFAFHIISLYKQLVENQKEFVLSKQLVRSGTSIGANVEEAIGAQSKREFAAKMSIAYKNVVRHIIGCVCCETPDTLKLSNQKLS